MLRLTLVLVAGCTAATPATSRPAVPEPGPIASSTGTPAPWPEIVAVPAPALRTQTRPLPLDMAQLRELRDLAISPDGASVAYGVRWPTFDPKAKSAGADDTKGGWKVEQQLFVVDRTGGTPRQLTFGKDPATSPRFSPDGRSLAFMRKHGDKRALHVIELAGGEARVITLGDYAPQGYNWAPDGKAFVFMAQRPASDERKAEQWKRGGARVYDEWHQTHLFVMPITGGEPRHINRGSDSVMSFAWSPDGKRIALVLAKSADPVDTFHKLVVVSAADGGNARELDHGDGKTPFMIAKVAWSPDSQQLAYTVTARGGLSYYDELRVHDGAKVTNIAGKLDLGFSGLAWSADARSIVVLADVRTSSKLLRLSLDGRGAKEIAIGRRVMSGLQADRSGRYLAVVSSTATTPRAPTVIDVERTTVREVAAVNPEVAKWTIAPSEVVTWKNREGVALEGVLTVTTHAKAGVPPPLVVIPHGGPDAVTSQGFGSWAQFLAARGYSVFEPNYRGSLGYGRAFYEANRGKLGAVELADIESGVDALIAARKADRGRLFYGGWSWGGYLSAYTLGHTGTRYRAFMVGAGVIDVVLQYVASDINHGPAADWEYKGRPWAQPDTFERANPSRALTNAKSPTLIFHGESDDRVPFVNGQILYRALADRGVAVKFWAYPRATHGFEEPAHVAHMMETWAAFFDQHNQ